VAANTPNAATTVAITMDSDGISFTPWINGRDDAEAADRGIDPDQSRSCVLVS
jgi:hypothetical protein